MLKKPLRNAAPLLALAVLTAAGGVRADEGEIALDASVRAEGAALSSPVQGPLSMSVMPALKPRAGLGLRYGLTDSLSVGALFEGAAGLSPTLSPTYLVTEGVEIAGYRGDLYSRYVEGTFLASLSWRLDFGWNYTGVFEVQAGPKLAWWAHGALADPSRPDTMGLPKTILGPQSIPLTLWPGALLRIQGGFEARLFDHVLVFVAPYASVAWAGAPSAAIGITLRPSVIFPRWMS